MASSSKHAQLSYTEMFTADELIVELDGVTYTLANQGDGKYGLGSSPTSINPIGITYVNGVNTMYIERSFNAGDHHVVIKGESSSIETSECFKKAVHSISSMRLFYNPGTETVEGATFSEALKALENGAMLFLDYHGATIPFVASMGTSISFEQTRVASEGVTSVRVQWGYDGTVTISSVTYPSQN